MLEPALDPAPSNPLAVQIADWLRRLIDDGTLRGWECATGLHAAAGAGVAAGGWQHPHRA